MKGEKEHRRKNRNFIKTTKTFNFFNFFSSDNNTFFRNAV